MFKHDMRRNQRNQGSVPLAAGTIDTSTKSRYCSQRWTAWLPISKVRPVEYKHGREYLCSRFVIRTGRASLVETFRILLRKAKTLRSHVGDALPDGKRSGGTGRGSIENMNRIAALADDEIVH